MVRPRILHRLKVLDTKQGSPISTTESGYCFCLAACMLWEHNAAPYLSFSSLCSSVICFLSSLFFKSFFIFFPSVFLVIVFLFSSFIFLSPLFSYFPVRPPFPCLLNCYTVIPHLLFSIISFFFNVFFLLFHFFLFLTLPIFSLFSFFPLFPSLSFFSKNTFFTKEMIYSR